MNDFYRVEDFCGSSPMLIKGNILLKVFVQSVMQQTDHKDKTFTIFYHWRPLNLKQEQNLSLEQIVKKDPMEHPVFYICDDVTEDEINPQYKQIFDELKEHLYVDDKLTKSYWYGANGHMLLDNRNLGLLASSIKKATNTEEFKKTHGQENKEKIKQELKESLIMEDKDSSPTKYQNLTKSQELIKRKDSAIKREQQGSLRKFMVKLGVMKKKPSSQNLLGTVQALKEVKTQEDLLKHMDYSYSNFDTKFATYLQAVYIKFAIKSAFKLHYIEYKSWDFGIIKSKFSVSAKIGIIGDFGTGLTDSIKLLEHMIMVKKVDIIIHLGDVYYAGTPQEYQQNVLKPLNMLRIKAKRQVIFYSIPGNHDYYSWGLPFLCFIKEVNQDQFVRQQASYFCLRSEDDSWQFLGIDTAYHDSNPLDQISVGALGPRIRHKQLSWHKEKLNNFRGSTIVLTHHQLYSIHDRICGSLSAYRTFSCMNPLLSSQLFQYMPYFSGWYWGHQHAFMLYADDVFGGPRCRLLGNSSFHVVFEKEHPYKRRSGFPNIPFIVSDEEYLQKYLPTDPNSNQLYFNLTYALIDMAKSDLKKGLNIEYICCPCFQQRNKDQPQFKPYLLYQEVLQSREEIQKNFRVIKNGSVVWLKMETGLIVDYGINLASKDYRKNKCDFNLTGKPFIVQRAKSTSNDEATRDEEQISLKTLKDYYYITLDELTNSIYLTPEKTADAIWIIKKSYIGYDQGVDEIKYRNTLKLKHSQADVYLSWKMEQGLMGSKGKIAEAIWMFLQKSLVGV